MAKKVSTADKFTNYFDNDWKTAKSTIRVRTDNNRKYDPTYSWDAKVDNPASFSKLEASYPPFQPVKPIVLSGAAVITLENTNGLNAINVKQPDKSKSIVPLTPDQEAIGMENNWSVSIPVLKSAYDANKVLVAESAGFRNNAMNPPKFEEMEVPEYYVKAGPQCDQKLLTPYQRRAIVEFEKKKHDADKIARHAMAERIKTKKQMTGLQFHRGVLMMDSSSNVESEIYGEKAQQEMNERESKEFNRKERSNRLATNTSSIINNGNILVPDSIQPHVKTEKSFQSKGGKQHGLTYEEIHYRIFERNADKVHDPIRSQNLRDLELSGKNYNIVTNAEIVDYPSRPVERYFDKRLLHPSQVSLESVRNMQGSLKPY